MTAAPRTTPGGGRGGQPRRRGSAGLLERRRGRRGRRGRGQRACDDPLRRRGAGGAHRRPPADRCGAGRGTPDRRHRHRGQPARLARRRPVVPAREARSPLQGREPHRATSASSGTPASSTTSRSTSTRNDGGVVLRFVVRERPNIKAIELRGQRRDRQRQAERGGRGQAEHHPERPGRAPQRPEDPRHVRGEGLLPRRRRRTRSCRSANNEVIVKFKITEHEPVTVRRITFIGNEHVADDELRDVMLTGNGGFFSFGSGGPFRQDVFERDVLVLSALYYDRGYLCVQIGTPRVMLTPDREGIEITHRRSTRARATRSASCASTSGTTTGNEIEPLGGRRALRADGPRQVRRLLQPRRARRRTCRRVRTLYRDAGYANVEAEPETELDPGHAARSTSSSRSSAGRSSTSSASRSRATPRRATRSSAARWRSRKGSSSARRSSSDSQAPHHGARLLRARRRLDRAGLGARQDQRQRRGRREADRHVPGRRRLLEHRELHRDGAGAAGEPLRQRPVARAPGAGLRRSGSSSRSASSSRTSSTPTGRLERRALRPAPRLPDFSQPIARRLAHLRLPAHRSRGCASRSRTRREHDTVDTRPRRHVLRHGDAGFVSVFQRLPLANLFNDGLHVELRPALTYDTRDNRLFPTSGIYLQASTELATRGASAARSSSSATASRAASTTRSARHRQPGRFVLKLNTEARHRHEPVAAGRADLRALLPRRHPRRARLPPAHASARACRSTRSLDPNAPPIANGANIGGNLEYYQNLELEFPIIDKVGIRGVVFTDAGNAWNTEDQFCQTTPAPAVRQGRAARASTSPAASATCAPRRASASAGSRRSARCASSGASRSSRCPTKRPSVFEFTIGNFF